MTGKLRVNLNFTINMIAAIGEDRQLGLDGHLPWTGRLIDGHLVAARQLDMRIFVSMTKDAILIAGSKTYDSITAIIESGVDNREVIKFTREKYPVPEFLISELASRQDVLDGRAIWVIGGAETYKALDVFINGLRVINRLPYFGPADVYFPEELLS